MVSEISTILFVVLEAFSSFNLKDRFTVQVLKQSCAHMDFETAFS